MMRKSRISHEQAYEYRMEVHREWLKFKNDCEAFGGIPNSRNFVKKWNADHGEFNISYSYFMQKIKNGPQKNTEHDS